MFGQMASIIVKTLRNANLVASRCFKRKRYHFRLTCVAQKRLCSSSLLINIHAEFRSVTFKLEVY